MQNEAKVVKEQNEDEKYEPASRLLWHRMSDQTRIDYLKKVFTTGVYLQDTRQIALGTITADAGTIFSIRDLQILPYDFFDNIHCCVTYEFDLTYYEMERTAYNLLDWFGDMGGLLEALWIFFVAIYAFMHYQTFDNFLVQKLFRTEEGATLTQINTGKDD